MESNQIHKKLVSGFLSLTFRKAVLDAISFITIYIVLAKILPVSLIGIFGIASTILLFFTYFSDIGLAGALVQKKDLKEDDLKTTFLIQQILVVVIVIFLWFSAPFFVQFYVLQVEAMWLIRALAFGFLLTSFKVIPSVLLERELNFKPIVWVDIAESLTFNGLLIFLSFQNYGIAAFSWAVVGRSLIGVITIYLLAPWRMRIGFSKSSIKDLTGFGLPFQLNSILALVKDRLTPLITAKIIGDLGMGYVTWAQGITSRPLEIMSIIIRVTFPAFSRLQDERDKLKKIVETSLFITVLIVYPLLFGLIAVTPSLVDYLGKDKWQPALPLIYLYGFATFWSVPSTIYTNVLNGIGRINTSLKLMIMWTALTWILSPLFALQYGFIGVGMAAALINITSLIPIIMVNRLLKIDFLDNIWQPFVAALIMGILTFFVSQVMVQNLLTLVLTILFGAVLYLVLIYLFAKNKIILQIKNLKDA